MINSLIRFTIIAVVSTVSVMLILGVAGVLSSSEIWSNATKVVEIAGILLVGSALILFVSKK